MKKKFVIGFVGKLGSGKDECANYLARKFKGEIIVFSHFITDALDVFAIPPVRENITWTITTARKRLGNDTLAKVMTEKIKVSKNSLFILPGVRKLAEVKFLRKFYGKNFLLVSIECDDKKRWERVEIREKDKKVKKDSNQKNLAEFLKREKSLPTEREITRIQKIADNEVVNNGSKKRLRGELDSLVKKICKSQRVNKLCKNK